MYNYILVFFSFTFFIQVFGGTSNLTPCSKDECYIDKTCLKKDEGYTPKDECKLFECVGAYDMTKASWCEDLSALPPGCNVIPEELGKPYPECCARAKCPQKYSNYTGEGICDFTSSCFFDGKCYSKNEKFQHKDFCIEYTCRGFNQTSKQTCAIPSVTAGCKIIEWSPGAYPDCCPKVIC